MVDRTKLSCSFCGKPATAVKKLIAGPEVYICNECVNKCHSILLGEPTTESKTITVPDEAIVDTPPTPGEIKFYLDQYIVGQDFAKEILAVSIYNHLKRIMNPIIDGVEIEKGNLVIVGQPGCGKTLLVQTIAKFLDVPFVNIDATSLTESGYVGDDVDSIINKLYQASNNDVQKTERGIVFIDEIDKKRQNNSGGNLSRDVSGEGVQQSLLKILEGTDVFIFPGMKRSSGVEMTKINTKNILFIVGGAFVGLDKIIDRELSDGQGSIGFGAQRVGQPKMDSNSLLRKIAPTHLIEFGLIPELVGRLPIIVPLSDLDVDQLVMILTEPKNAITKQFRAMFQVEGIQLDFTTEALQAIAKTAKARKTNGRSLRGVLETILMKTQFNLPDLRKQGATRIIVGIAAVNGGNPDVIFEKQLTTD